MKNLKKVVALSLAAIMMFGMMVVGAGAAPYTDADKIVNTTAVDVISAIEVLQGDNGVFDPTGNLTRAQAVTIAARIKLGVDKANTLEKNPTATSFTDVPATHWASGLINWAAKDGIVEGHGDGTFTPDAELTSMQFAKILLCVLGYRSDIEDYESSEWAINVAYDAVTAGLLTDTGIVLDNEKPISRDNAALMAFNAITVCNTYGYTNEQVPADNILGFTYVMKGADKKDALGNYIKLMDDYRLEYVEADYTTDSVIGGYWIRNDEDGDPILDEEGNVIKLSTPVEVAPTVVLDKEYTVDEVTKMFSVGDTEYTYDNTVAADATALSGLTGTGVTVNVWVEKDTNTIWKVTYGYETIVNVTVDFDEATELYTFAIDTDFGVYSEDEVVSYDDAEDADNSKYDALVALGIEESAYVNLTVEANHEGSDWTAAALAEKVTGTVTKIASDAKSFVLGGGTLYIAENENTASVAASLTAVQDFWLDSNGKVLLVETVQDNDPDTLYLYITKVSSVAGEWNSTDGAYDPAFAVTGFDLTGEKHTFNVGANNYVKNSNWATGHDHDNNPGSYTTLAAGQFVTYTLNKDGDKLVAADVVTEDGTVDADVEDYALEFDGSYITDSTDFIYFYTKSVNGNPVYCYEVITGAHFIAAANIGNYYVIETTGSELDSVVLIGAPYVDTTPDYAQDLIYVAETTSYDSAVLGADGETPVYLFEVYLNGAVTEITLGANGDITAGWYAYTINEDGVYTLKDDDDVDGEGNPYITSTVVTSENVYGDFSKGNGKYYVTVGSDKVDVTEAAVYNLTKVSAGTVARLATLSGSTAYDTITIAIQYTTDTDTGLHYATAIYVLAVGMTCETCHNYPCTCTP